MVTHTHHMEDGLPSAAAAVERPRRHGMAVLGTDAVFLSHLPMFSMNDHAYQVLDVRFARPDGRAVQEFIDDRAKHPNQRLYTFDPNPFLLPDILRAGGGLPRLRSINGELWRNHFEREDTHPVLIASGVTVTIEDVIHGRKFDPAAVRPRNLDYIVFGKDSTTYLAHLLTRAPDFDQLIQVEIGHPLSDDELRSGLRLTVDGRADTSAARIREGSGPIRATLHAADGKNIAVEVQPGGEFYSETGELQLGP
ncbi:MAG: hypothetical protein WA988_09700, partial [Candidatus Nanopelagicales bacterium]